MEEIALISTISVAGLLVILNRLRACAVDYFRENVFSLRSDLFDLAASGGIPFDHQAYGMLRGILNGFIRGAHEVRLFSPLTYSVLRKDRLLDQRADDLEATWQEALASLPEPTSEKLAAYRTKMHMFWLSYIVYGSPALLVTVVVPLLVTVVVPVVLAITWFAFGVAITDAILKYCGKLLEDVDRQALRVGKNDSLAIVG